MRTTPAGIALAFAASFASLALACWASLASAQEEPDLAAARKRFADGLVEEQSGHYAAALEEFQQVQTVRDTQSVRYRIATCLDALGRLKQALTVYETTSIPDPGAESAGIAQASRDRIAALEQRLAHLVVTAPAHDAGTTVTLDGDFVPPNALGTPIVVDPGTHEVVATQGGAAVFRKTVTLGDGGDIRVEVTLGPGPAAAEARAIASPAPGAAAAPADPGANATRTRTTAGLVSIGAGGVFVAGAVALVLARHSDIQSLEAACPGGTCPDADESSLTSTRNRALVEGPLAIGVACAGVIGVGVGIYLLAVKPQNHAPAQALRLSPWFSDSAGGAAVSGRF